jgi:FMN phosphatase YigB (HAD superfamily)
MIAVAMFDLGGTLLDETTMQVFPGVLDALGSIKNLHTSGQQPLRMAIVSNFRMPDGDMQPDQIKTLFDEYVAILDQAGLRPFFEPIESRVTLSTHVGVRKPDCRVFQACLWRLGLPGDLSSALLITEEAQHIARAKQMGMQALRFGPNDASADFQHWHEARDKIAALLV